MNVLCMAIIDLHSLVCWKLKPLPFLVENIHLSRKVLLDQLRQMKDRQKLIGTQLRIDQFGSSNSIFSGKRKEQSEMNASPTVPSRRVRGKQTPPPPTPPAPAPAEFEASSSVSATAHGVAHGPDPNKDKENVAAKQQFNLLSQIRRQISRR